MKNILFYYIGEISPSVGGAERVISLQYYKLTEMGYHIFTIYGIRRGKDDLIPKQYPLPFPEQLDAKENTIFIKDFLEREHINLVLNFAAVFNKSSRSVVEACKIANVPLISVFHNTLKYLLWKLPIVKLLMNYHWGREVLSNVLKVIHRVPFYKGGHYLYKNTSATVLLAPCYLEEFRKIIYKKAINLYSIYNPLTIKTLDSSDWEDKQPIALFVGRLEKQKSVDKLIRAWAKLGESSWKLYIVGSGSQEQYLKRLAHELRISDSISFEGHQSPLAYYRKAKLFCLTSIYEGYPMTLIECQAYGVVPVIYDSFLASHDVIDSGKNGVIVPAFNENRYVEVLKQLMRNDDYLRKMSINCREASKRYSIDNIMDQWVTLIEKYAH